MDTDLIYALLVVVGLVFLDWVLGILTALRDGTVQARQLPRQLWTTVLPVVGGLVALAIVQALAEADTRFGPEAAGAFYLAAGAYTPLALLDILDKARRLVARTPAAP